MSGSVFLDRFVSQVLSQFLSKLSCLNDLTFQQLLKKSNMMNKRIELNKCVVCGQNYPVKNLTPIGAVRKAITEEILHDFPECSSNNYICQTDLSKYRMQYVHASLKS